MLREMFTNALPAHNNVIKVAGIQRQVAVRAFNAPCANIIINNGDKKWIEAFNMFNFF